MATKSADKNSATTALRTSTQEVLAHLYDRRTAVDQLIRSLEAYQSCLSSEGRGRS